LAFGAIESVLRRFGVPREIPTPGMALPHKSLDGGRILCPKKPCSPNVADDEKADFSRIRINTYYYVDTAGPGVFSSRRDFSTTRSKSKHITK